MNIGTIVDIAATGDPDRVALIIGNRRIGYGELATAVERCAAGLAANGVVAGNRVAVVDGGSVLSIASVLGAARIGAAAALMNPALTSPELRDMLRNAGCVGVGIAGESYAGQLRAAGATKTLTPADLLNGHQLSRVSPVDEMGDRDALVLFTSGTTGLPKAVGITSGQLTARIRGIGAPFRANAAATVGMMCVPFFHSAARWHVAASTRATPRSFRNGSTPALAALGAGASGMHPVPGADDAPANPTIPTSPHRPELAAGHRLRCGRRARRAGAPCNGRAATCRVCQRVRPDRDTRRLHHLVAGGSPRPQTGSICRQGAARSRGASSGSQYRQRRREFRGALASLGDRSARIVQSGPRRLTGDLVRQDTS